MHKQQELVISYIGNGKSTNRYHLPFALNRPEKIKVKTVYQRTLGKGSWTPVAGITYTDNLSEMLADQEIQAVIICTPVGSHKSLVEQVLKAGKHCVVEKPFALNLKDAEDMFRLAEEKGLILECYQNRRFDSDFLTTQQVIESGRLGQLFEVNMNYDYYRPQVPEGEKNYRQDQAFLYTHACHTVDQVLSYFGQPQDVRCDVRQLLGKGRMNDYFDLDFYYDGLKVSVKSSYFRAKARPSFAVYGTRGVFIKETEDRQEADLKKFYLPAGHEDFGQDLPEHYGTLIYYDDAGLYHEEKVPTVTGDYARYYDALYETIIKGAPPLVTKEQTLAQMKILEKAGENLA